MILHRNAETGWWTEGPAGYRLVDTHSADDCVGRLCDIHDRRGAEPWASWPLNWREDRRVLEMIDPFSGIGHLTPAQVQFFNAYFGDSAWAHISHGCDGGCAGAYEQIGENA